MDYKELATPNFQSGKKINAKYAGIVSRKVSRLNFPEASYFEILYFDNEDKQWYCGFGSYTYSFVDAWLKSEFEPTYNRLETAITDLLARAEAAEARAEKAERERDVAIKSIPHECETCFYHTVGFNGSTIDHDCTNPDGGCSNNYDRWIWRGDKEE